MTSRVEAVAEILWHRYSPDHEGSWPSPNADEYRRVASDILSAITTEPAAPEGWQEAVAWLYDWTDENGTTQTSADTHKIASVNCKPARNYRPLFTRPSEQAVTEADKRRILAVFEIEWKINGLDPLSALRAAMEAGRYG